MEILFPKINFKQLPLILAFAAMGAGIAGTYGVIHDQVTYSISTEYFTKFKFHQFSHTDFGFPVRVRVSLIGFLATWWVGFFAGWFLGRMAVRRFSPKVALKYILRSFGLLLGCVFTAGVLGFLFGYYWLRGENLDSWSDWQMAMGLDDVRSFAIVGYIHNCGYLGAFLGLIAAMIYLKKAGGTMALTKANL